MNKQEILDSLVLNGREAKNIKYDSRVVYLGDALSIVNKLSENVIEFNENQKVVLEYLKDGERFSSPFQDISDIEDTDPRIDEDFYYVSKELSNREQFEVLQAFAAWGLEEGE